MTKSYRNLVIGGANPSGVARRHKARCNRRHERYQVSRAHLGCASAWGSDADRQAKSLTSLIRAGSLRRADSHHTIELRDIVSVRFGLPLEEASGTFQSRVSVVDDRLKREGKDSPNTKYRSRSALLQERASKLVSGSGELTTRVEPAMIGCEA